MGDKFLSNQVMQKIFEFNEKARMNATAKKLFRPIEISEDGLELIEYLSVDCTDVEGERRSDSEIKIDKLGYVRYNGKKQKNFELERFGVVSVPQRLKICNIYGDEIHFDIPMVLSA